MPRLTQSESEMPPANHLNIHCTIVGDEQKQNWLELVYGGSEIRWRKRDLDADITVIPSRRGFEPYFDHVQIIGRESYNRERPTPAIDRKLLTQHRAEAVQNQRRRRPTSFRSNARSPYG